MTKRNRLKVITVTITNAMTTQGQLKKCNNCSIAHGKYISDILWNKEYKQDTNLAESDFV